MARSVLLYLSLFLSFLSPLALASDEIAGNEIIINKMVSNEMASKDYMLQQESQICFLGQMKARRCKEWTQKSALQKKPDDMNR